MQKEINKSKHHRLFCNNSCAASFNNHLKRKSRRSKVEIKLFHLLQTEFPDLDLLPTNKTLLDGYEVDIACPSLKLGIEWNGIVHFKPIYGEAKLTRIQQRDEEKQRIAQKKGVMLIIIPDLVSNDSTVRQAFGQIAKIIRNLSQ